MGAANQGHERVVKLLLQHGVEVNLQNSFGETALMLAADNERVVDLLLRTARRSTCGTTSSPPR